MRNTDSVTGSVTPQVYLTLPASTGEPGHRLVGYSQITLRPGQSRRITVTVNPDSSDHPLSYYTAPGTYTFQVGSDSQTTPLNESVRFS